MFPNVRLLIGALFGSVIALSCGFGVFAAFRVNHDPLSRMPADTISLQLIADEAAKLRPTWGVRVQTGTGAAQAVGTIVDAPMPLRHVAVEPPAPIASQTATMDAAVASPLPKLPPPPNPPTAPASVAPATAPVLKPDAAGRPPEPAQAAIHSATASEPSPQPAPPPHPDQITGSLPQSVGSGTAPEGSVGHPALRKKVTRKPAARRRVVVIKRRPIRQAHAPSPSQSGAQNSAFSEPVFQSAPNFYQPQTQRPPANTTVNSNSVDSASRWPSAE